MKKNYMLGMVMLVMLPFFTAGQQRVSVADNPPRKKTKTALNPLLQESPGGDGRCGFGFWLNQARAKGFNDALYESQLKSLIERQLQQRTNFTGPVTIPVIFHVIFRNGQAEGAANSPNISQAQVNAQIAQLNADYANLSGSIWPQALDVQIQFCAAIVDTAGRFLAQPGINRINGQTQGWSNTNTMNRTTLVNYFEGTIKPQSVWDPYRYFNVWSAAMNSSGLLGYASFPSLSTLPGLTNSETDNNAGVVLNWQSIGSVSSPGPSASYGFGRTLTHEAGHYFGLRHIWGDAACGDDYCSDTPPQDQETAGCPAHPAANNCIPAGNKMFQNYMDYSNDACLNTFTGDQALRCQTVMDNSPRRKELITSGACQARPGNAIVFSRAAGTVPETGVSGTCPMIRTYQVNLVVAAAATGGATVTFLPGGTATLNSDYTISPASVSYANGDNSLKTVTITINDDKAAEIPETITISYTITGAGVVAGPEKQTFTLTIADDDFQKAVNQTTPTVTLLSENFQSSVNIPAGWTTEAYAITVPGNQWVVSTNGGSTFGGSNVAHITRNTATKPNTYNNANESDAYLITPLIDATGLGNLALSFNWRCTGEIDFDEGYIGYIPEGMAPTAANVIYFNTVFSGQSTVQTANLSLPASMSNTRFYFVFNWYNDDILGTNPGFTIDNIVFTGRALQVATAAGSTMTAPMYNGQTSQFISGTSPNEEIIARVSGLNQDIGCITANVQAAGTGNTPIITSGGNGFRSNKVVRITPAVANGTASYQVTLYYTTAEMAGWLPGEIPTLKLMKLVNDAYIDNIYSVSDGHVIPTTFSNQSVNGYYAYTGTVTDGFSDYILVSSNIVLPANLVRFEATAGTRNIRLIWSTAQEQNNKGFAIDRSTDGSNFSQVGWVSGAGTASSQTDYTYTDNFVVPGVIYYYRLRQTDFDGNEKQTVIRQAKIAGDALIVSLSPNPAKEEVSLFIAGDRGKSDVDIVNASGQVVRSWKNISNTGGPVRLNINKLPPGVYIVAVHLESGVQSRKLIIK